MMTVTAIEAINSKKVKVTFDEQFTLVLYKGELKLFGIKEGAVLPEDTLQRIEKEVLEKRAVKYAMNLLLKRDYTEKELRDKLAKAGYREETTKKAIDYVASYHYVDDASYARRYLETYSDRKSRRMMQMELKKKGVADDVIEQALSEAELEREQDTLHAYAVKKAKGLDLASDKDKQRFLRYLLGKGFSYQDAKEELSGLLKEDED